MKEEAAMDFRGKTALVTGAAVGIGRACVLRFAEEGANVVPVDIDPEGLAKLRAELERYGDRVMTEVCDVSDLASLSDLVAAMARGIDKDFQLNRY